MAQNPSNTAWMRLLLATMAGALAAGVIGWQFYLAAVRRQIKEKNEMVKKLVIGKDIPPNEEVMDYLSSRAESIEKRYESSAALLGSELDIASVTDPQLYFQERFHGMQRILERLAIARGFEVPEQLGFPSELPPAEVVPRLLVQLELIEDAADVIMEQGVSSLESFKIEDPEYVLESERETTFLMKLPVKVRLGASLSVLLRVLDAMQDVRPVIDLQGVQIAADSVPEEGLKVDLVLSRYLVMADVTGIEVDLEEESPSRSLRGNARKQR